MTPRQKAFVEHYVKTWCGAQAARLAGYSRSGDRQVAVRLLSNANIRAEIDRLQRERFQGLQIDLDDILREISAIAFVDIGHIVDLTTGQMLPDIPVFVRRAISSVKIVSRTTARGERVVSTSIRLCDKLQALDKLGRRLGLYAEVPALSQEERIEKLRAIFGMVPPSGG